MPDVVRPAHPDEDRAVFALLDDSFSFGAGRWERWRERVDYDDVRVLIGDRGAVVAAGEFARRAQFFGRRSVPTATVDYLAVRADRRSEGIGSRLLTETLPELRDRGDAISTLQPTSTRFYRDLGWEVAGVAMRYELPPRALARLPRPRDLPVRRASFDDVPAMRACYARAVRWHPGPLDRDAAAYRWWSREDFDQPHRYWYVVERRGEVGGYLTFQHEDDPEADLGYRLVVGELVAWEPSSHLGLWAVLGAHASMVSNVTFTGPPEPPVLMWLPEQDVKVVEELRWMTRLVDAQAAIAARGYPRHARVDLPLEITDTHAPWNAGWWRLHIAGGEGVLERGDASTGLRVDIGTLAALYTGWASPWTLARLGLLDGLSDYELQSLRAAFTGRTPWMYEL